MQPLKECPWVIVREGTVCGEFSNRRQAEAGMQQLAKLYPPGTKLMVQYVGKNIHHCTQGGKPLD